MKSGGARALGGVGLGYRPELAADLLLDPHVVDFVEVVAETCFTQKSTRREAQALAEVWPVVPHGVKLSLGSAEGLDDVRARRLASLVRELRAPMVSEHVSFTRGGGREIGHLTHLPRSRESVRVVARNVARLRSLLPDVPLLLENVAANFDWPAHEEEMDEGQFYTEVAHATGCPLLLDVGNLYANAVNAGTDPRRVLAGYPLDRVAMLHIAGGVTDDGFYFDTHAHPIPDPVFALVSEIFSRRPDVPVLLERDANFDSFAHLRAELHRVRSLRVDDEKNREVGRAGDWAIQNQPPSRSPTLPVKSSSSSSAPLAPLQSEVARLLVDPAPPAGALADAIGLPSLHRARGVLSRKRVDDALPLLARLSRRTSDLRALAERLTESTPRAARGAGPADAMRIAEAACAEAPLRDDALHDRLMLRARFSRPDAQGVVLPRFAPFVGAETLSDGTRIRVLKGFGAFAPVRFQEKKALVCHKPPPSPLSNACPPP